MDDMARNLTVQEPLRDLIGRALYEKTAEEQDAEERNWYALSEDRREPWRRDADNAIEVVARYLTEHIGSRFV